MKRRRACAPLWVCGLSYWNMGRKILFIASFLAVVSLVKSAPTLEANTMKRAVPTISDREGFEENVSGYLKKGDRLALLLDYDGTLAPLADHPNNTAMEPETEEVLKRLVAHPNVFTAIISGRGPVDARNKVALPNITYAGNHGLEIHYPNGTKWEFRMSDEVKRNYAILVDTLENQIARQGAWLENKKASLTFHYREVPKELQAQLHEEAEKAILALGFLANNAHCAVEAKPAVKWNKGEAALEILRGQFGDNWAADVRAIFVGDDTTDEDAMLSLQNQGRSFRVSPNAAIQTYADFRLPSTKTVSTLLSWIEQRL